MTAPAKGPLGVEPEPCQWWLVKPVPHDLCGVTVDRLPQMSGPDLFAVHYRGYDLSAAGEWDWRPIPSSRTEEWLATHRFRSLDEAVAVYVRAARLRQEETNG